VLNALFNSRSCHPLHRAAEVSFPPTLGISSTLSNANHPTSDMPNYYESTGRGADAG
jgi:hypothetical protein